MVYPLAIKSYFSHLNLFLLPKIEGSFTFLEQCFRELLLQISLLVLQRGVSFLESTF